MLMTFCKDYETVRYSLGKANSFLCLIFWATKNNLLNLINSLAMAGQKVYVSRYPSLSFNILAWNIVIIWWLLYNLWENLTGFFDKKFCMVQPGMVRKANIFWFAKTSNMIINLNDDLTYHRLVFLQRLAFLYARMSRNILSIQLLFFCTDC